MFPMRFQVRCLKVNYVVQFSPMALEACRFVDPFKKLKGGKIYFAI